MTTEFMFFVLMIYLVVNVWTDVRTLKTKNKWHLGLGLFVFGVGSFFYGMSISLLVVLTGSLLVGILLMKIPKVELGAGDVKMMMVISMFLQIIKPTVRPITIVFVLIASYITLTFLIHSILKFVQMASKREISFFSYRITKKEIVTPEAPIFFVVCLAFAFSWGVF